MVFQIAYMSAALPGLSDADVHGILKASNVNNKRDGLSGMLLLIDGTFFQVLEGERERVEETYRRIARDPRHSALTRVLQQERAERTFPDWSMGFEKFMKIDDLDEALPFDASDLSRDPSIARLREKAPELVSFMRALYASRGMRGAPKLD